MSKPYVVGIDIGGTNTVFGIVDARGSILATGSIKTQKYTEITDNVNALHEELSRLLAQENVTDQIAGIGIGAPNGNYFNGTIVINGQMAYGHDGFAGELGHVIVRRGNGRLCGCGRTGCLEAYTSATGVARTAREFLELRNDESTLRQLPIQEITSKDVYDAAVSGDKLSQEIFEYTGTILGEAFADFIAFSSPKMIVLFGGLAKSGELIMRPIREAMEKKLLAIYKGKVKLVLSELKESDAAVLGASALGWEAS